MPEKRTLQEVSSNIKLIAEAGNARGMSREQIKDAITQMINLEGYTPANIAEFNASPKQKIGRAAPTQAESAIAGGLQGVTLGFGDELTGAIGALTGQGGFSGVRDSARENIEAAREANPKTFLGAEVAGSLAPGLAAQRIGLTTLPASTATAKRVGAEGAAVGGVAGLGSAEGDILEQGSQSTGGAVIGGALGAFIPKAAEVLGIDKAMGVVGRALNNAFESVTGRPISAQQGIRLIDEAGNITPIGQSTLQRFEANDGSLDKLLTKELDNLQKSGGFVPKAEEVSRFQQLTDEGMQPTMAQVTQKADDFQIQQELGKANPAVRGRLDEQNRTAQEKIEARALETEGEAFTQFDAGASMADAIIGRANKYDDGISALYSEAREAAPNAKNVKFTSLAAALKKSKFLDKPSVGTVGAVKELFESAGLVDAAGNATGRTTAEVSESLRQELNRLSQTNSISKGVIHDLKAELDADVFRAAGGDFFDKARGLKRDFHEEFDGGRLTKFDEKLKNPLRRIIDGSIESDAAFKKFVTQGSNRELKTIVEALGKDEAGQMALKGVRSAWIREALEKATKGGKTTLDDSDFNQSIFSNEIKQFINSGKMKTLFDADQINGLINLNRTLKLRRPVTGTALGKGPSGAIAKDIAAIVEDVLTGGSKALAVGASRMSQKKANERIARESARVLNPLQEVAAKLEAFKRPRSLTAIGAGAAGAQSSNALFDLLTEQKERD